MMAVPIRVLLADDHPLVRAGLRATVAVNPDIVLVGEAITGDEARRLSDDLHPDVLVLDLSMPGPPTLETVVYIRTHWPAIQIVILTAHNAVIHARELVAHGVTGYVLKDDPLDAVVRAIRAVSAGGTWFSRPIMAKLVPGQSLVPGEETPPDLTARERQLLRLLIGGWDTSRLAVTLGVTEQTLRNYLSRLYDTLGVHTRAEATAWAYHHGFTDD
jgi:DNA-binding NarL/FixJ family response regulator